MAGRFQLSLRQKILLSYVIVALICMAIMYPASSYLVRSIVNKALFERSAELIARIQDAPDDYSLVERLKEQKYAFFFRVGIVTNENKLLYDSYTKRLLGPRFERDPSLHPEVVQAFKTGIGYNESESKTLHQRFFYVARAFDFHGKTYVMRTAFPSSFVGELTRDVELGFISVSFAVLLLSSLLTWFLINRIISPVRQIVSSIKPYQEGRIQKLPEIKLPPQADLDVQRLADTLNLLSARIQSHIDIITEERNERATILESLVEGIIAVNDQMQITYANAVACDFLGKDSRVLVGQSLQVIEQPECLTLLEACLQTNALMTDTVQIQKNTQILHLDIVAVPKSHQSGAVLVMEDKSMHYKLLAMRKDFVANASHELKTPITIIRGFAETLHDNPELPRELCLTITEKILQNCKRMAKLVKDLLVLTDVENIPLSRLMDCDLLDLIEQCTQTVHSLYPDAKISIDQKAAGEIFVHADAALLEMAIINLLDNAVKYSQPPADINVTIDQDAIGVHLTITDKGMGIPAEDLEFIFQRFYTVNKAHSRKLGGSGLGLSLVKTIIEKHHGTVSVSSELGKGTSFTIFLPH